MILEVIVTTVEDAREAAIGGADRLEVVRDIADGGLTPPFELVHTIAAETPLPLRVMVRENRGYETSDAELEVLRRAAKACAEAGVDGIVVGFARGGQVLFEDVCRVIEAAPEAPATYHRAFDRLNDPIRAIAGLTAIPQVDRILTSGGYGSYEDRCARLQRLSDAAGRLTIVAGGGVDEGMLAMIAATGCVREAHVGRAARPGGNPQTAVSADLVRRLRRIAGS